MAFFEKAIAEAIKSIGVFNTMLIVGLLICVTFLAQYFLGVHPFLAAGVSLVAVSLPVVATVAVIKRTRTQKPPDLSQYDETMRRAREALDRAKKR